MTKAGRSPDAPHTLEQVVHLGKQCMVIVFLPSGAVRQTNHQPEPAPNTIKPARMMAEEN